MDVLLALCIDDRLVCTYNIRLLVILVARLVGRREHVLLACSPVLLPNQVRQFRLSFRHISSTTFLRQLKYSTSQILKAHK